MSNGNPIIIRGGASVEIEYPDTYTNEPAPAGKKKAKNRGRFLDWLEVDGKKVMELKEDSEVIIHTK